MSTAAQQGLRSSTQPQPVVFNVLSSVYCLHEILVYSSGPSVSTFDQPLASPAICSTVGPADLPNRSSSATSEVPHFGAKLCFHDVSRSASPWRHRRPNHVILAPVSCVDRTVTARNSSGCRVLHIVCIFLFHSSLFHLRFYLLQHPLSVHDQLRHAAIHHSAFRIFSPATFQRIHAISPVSISGWLPQTTMWSSVTFLTDFSLLLFDSAFCSTKQHLAYGLAPRFCLHSSHNLFYIVPFRSLLLCTAPLTSFSNDVFDHILSTVNGTDAPALLSVSFGI